MERLTLKLKKPTKSGFEYLGTNGATSQNVLKKLGELEDLEEKGLLLRLPNSDWNDLIKQLTTIIENDFIVYSDEREFIVNQIFFLEYDEEFRFSATCRCFNGTENDWWCDEECKYGEDGNGCYISFSFSYLIPLL